jgi:hypothetical protein
VGKGNADENVDEENNERKNIKGKKAPKIRCRKSKKKSKR